MGLHDAGCWWCLSSYLLLIEWGERIGNPLPTLLWEGTSWYRDLTFLQKSNYAIVPYLPINKMPDYILQLTYIRR